MGAVYMPHLTLDGWFDTGSAGHDRLLPIAEAAGTSTRATLMVDAP